MKAEGIEFGATSGCRFCLARLAGTPRTGDRIRVLGGLFSDRIGTLVENAHQVKLRTGEFLVHFDGEREDTTCILRPDRDLVEILPGSEIPSFEPPFETRLVADLDDLVAMMCMLAAIGGPTRAQIEAQVMSVVGYTWRHRLPMERGEAWRLFRAHGLSEEKSDHLADLFSFGRELLVSVVGRKPIRKRRMNLEDKSRPLIVRRRVRPPQLLNTG